MTAFDDERLSELIEVLNLMASGLRVEELQPEGRDKLRFAAAHLAVKSGVRELDVERMRVQLQTGCDPDTLDRRH